jgi:hypothetical protein
MWIVMIAVGVATGKAMLDRHPEAKTKICGIVDRVKGKKKEKPTVIKVVVVRDEESP